MRGGGETQRYASPQLECWAAGVSDANPWRDPTCGAESDNQLTHKPNPLRRYGGVEDLLRACARAGQLRTLQRVLAAGGARGCAALRSLCALLQDPGYRAADAPGAPGGPAAAGGGPCEAGGAAAGPAEAGGGGDGARGAAGGDGSATGPAERGSGGALTEVERLRFVYRCQLQLRLPDDAGAPGAGPCVPVPCRCGGPCAQGH
jgi:hypothetical protein